MFIFAFGVLGLIIGSFLNVLILRKGVESVSGRSHCLSCGRILAWQDLIPVISWIYLGGRCRDCGSGISIQYPLVEMITGIAFAYIGDVLGPELIIQMSVMYSAYVLLCLVLTALAIAISVYDFRHTIIPDEWAALFGVAALGISSISTVNTITWHMLGAGPIAALPLFLLWLVSGGRWMGLGDPKIALGIGWLLGFPLGIIAIFLSFIVGSATLIPLLLYEKLITHMQTYRTVRGGLTMKSEVPFGPFLIATALILWFFQLSGAMLPLEFFGF